MKSMISFYPQNNYDNSMRKLIIITGDLAAGKSTLASSLSEQLQMPFLTKDALKEIVCDIIGYQNREENRLLSKTATRDMVYFFKQCALVGADLILEANFRSEELREIKELVDEYEYRVALIILTGDIPLLYQRFLDRLPTRHIAHRSLNLDYSLERFTDYINEIRNEDLVFLPHYLDMSDLDEDEVTEKALDLIYDEFGE